MINNEIKNLEDIVPLVLEHLVPEIQQSVEVCIQCYNNDEFNDMWTFGTQLWRNIGNRFKTIAEFEDCPFEICGKGNEYKLKIGSFVIRHHRIDNESKIPNGAKAVKESARQHMLPFGAEWEAPIDIDNIVLAIDADIQNGLKEVFLGELKQKDIETKQYKWGTKIPVYLPEGIKASSVEIIQISNISGYKQLTPEEDIAEVNVGIDETKIGNKDIERESLK